LDILKCKERDLMEIVLTIPEEWGIEFDFFVSAKGNSMIELGITDGMIIFIKEQNKYKNGDILAITCKNWVNPILKKVNILSEGQMIFTSGNGQIIENNKHIKILGKLDFKMDNPYKNKLEDEQLDFWN